MSARSAALVPGLAAVAVAAAIPGFVGRTATDPVAPRDQSARPEEQPAPGPLAASARVPATPASLAPALLGAFPPPGARRPVRPLPLVTCEEFWRQVQPVFDLLPHMSKDDIHKLDYFCPADFNKDDQVDPHDLLLFARTWNDPESPLFNWCDLNADGFVDPLDAVEFIRRFHEGRRDGGHMKELRSTIC